MLSVRNLLTILLAVMFAVPGALRAQDNHVVSTTDLQKQAVSATQARAHNEQRVRDFMSTPAAQKTLRGARIDPAQVQRAVSNLSDAELSQLAARADKAQNDFAAGYLSTLDIALIVLGVALIILIIVVAS